MKTAILVIDMIRGLEKWVPKKRIEKILPNITRVLNRARKKRVPIIYILHRPSGSEGMKIYNAIKPTKKDFIIKKDKYSSFYKTKLDSLLRKLKVKNLILTGMATNWCVLSTALDAYYRGYKTILLKDCVTAPNDSWHRWAIKWMADTLYNFEIKTSNSWR